MDKDQVADILVDIGLLLELKGENPFKTRAYQNGARTIPLRVLEASINVIQGKASVASKSSRSGLDQQTRRQKFLAVVFTVL